MATTVDPLKVVTGKVRLSFVHLFKPSRQNDDQDLKFSCMILVPKTDQVTIKKIRKAQQAALEQGKSTKFNGSIPKAWKDTFRDADEEMDLEKFPEMEGHYFMTISAREDYPPGIVDAQVQPILDQSEVYSGCYARVSMRAFPFSSNGNKGVSFGLNHVQKVADGTPLGGTSSKAEDDFEAVDSEDEDAGVI